ncbi:MAG: 50S ribosomal protein L24 [Acidobacteria bacterium]|jgi:large subunit ribosomal protein L24|nr:50S ribosomal protein L24 [Acidobacteriota bacterium]
MTIRIKKNDQVVVLGGKDKGKRGRVLSVSPQERTAKVENVNFVKRHTRANPQKNIKGGILEKESPVPVSRLMVICKDCQKPTRLKAQVAEGGKKVRACKKCGAVQD